MLSHETTGGGTGDQTSGGADNFVNFLPTQLVRKIGEPRGERGSLRRNVGRLTSNPDETTQIGVVVAPRQSPPGGLGHVGQTGPTAGVGKGKTTETLFRPHQDTLEVMVLRTIHRPSPTLRTPPFLTHKSPLLTRRRRRGKVRLHISIHFRPISIVSPLFLFVLKGPLPLR